MRWFLAASLFVGHAALAGDGPASAARVSTAPWLTPASLALSKRGSPLAVYVVSLNGLTDEQTNRLAEDISGRAPKPGTLAVIDAADGTLLPLGALEARDNGTNRRVAVFHALRDAHGRDKTSTTINLPARFRRTAMGLISPRAIPMMDFCCSTTARST